MRYYNNTGGEHGSSRESRGRQPAGRDQTPLIDVLLVLLVMLIITIPPQTHSVKFDLPQPSVPIPPPNPTRNLLVIKADGSLRWNDAAIDQRQLRQLLAVTSQMEPAPELHLRPDSDARHGDVDRLLVLIKQEQIRRFGFVGNEQYRNVF